MFCGRSGVRGLGFQVSGLSGAWRLCLKSTRTMEGPCEAYKLMRPASEIRQASAFTARGGGGEEVFKKRSRGVDDRVMNLMARSTAERASMV